MSHYFVHDKSLKSDVKYIDYQFKGEKFKFVTDSGIFSKDKVDYATDILLNAIPVLSGNSRLLDIGCGYGCIGIILAKIYGLELTQSDINKAAVDLTRINCEYNGIQSKIIESDCFDNVFGEFDVITINPPIHAGKTVTYAMYRKSVEHLVNGGRLYVVTLKKHGAKSTLSELQRVFNSQVEVIYMKKGHYVFECFK